MIRRILSLVGIGLLVIGIMGCYFSFKNVSASTSTKAFTVSKDSIIKEDFNRIEVNSDNAEVDVLPTSNTAAQVKLTGKYEKNQTITFNSQVEGHTLKVALHNKQKNLINFDFFNQRLVLAIYLPKKQYNQLIVQANNGKLDIKNVNSLSINLVTHNGLMTLTNTHSKMVDVQSFNGKLSLSHVEGKLTGKTYNGEINVVTSDLDHPMNLKCNNGRIVVKTDKEPTNTRFQVHVDNGSVNILNKYKDDAVVGKGQNLVSLHADNGSITVTQ